MRTILIGFRVADGERSRAFYTALGYEVVGRVEGTPIGSLTMLKLPDEEFVSLELVEGDGGAGSGLDHIAIQVDRLDEVIADLRSRGIDAGDVETLGGPDGPRTSMIVDPDGYAVELTEWPPGHPVGMTPDDFA